MDRRISKLAAITFTTAAIMAGCGFGSPKPAPEVKKNTIEQNRPENPGIVQNINPPRVKTDRQPVPGAPDNLNEARQASTIAKKNPDVTNAYSVRMDNTLLVGLKLRDDVRPTGGEEVERVVRKRVQDTMGLLKVVVTADKSEYAAIREASSGVASGKHFTEYRESLRKVITNH